MAINVHCEGCRGSIQAGYSKDKKMIYTTSDKAISITHRGKQLFWCNQQCLDIWLDERV